jgi:serine/threonine-protein kinase RsbT
MPICRARIWWKHCFQTAASITTTLRAWPCAYKKRKVDLRSSVPSLSISDTFLETVQIVESVDVIWVRHRVSIAALEAGLTDRGIWCLAIAACELATNVLKFAGSGQIDIVQMEYPKRGIRIVVEDSGPGIENIEAATQDGFSEGRFVVEHSGAVRPRGLGSGLGAVKRLMDAVTIENRRNGGLRVIAEKCL